MSRRALRHSDDNRQLSHDLSTRTSESRVLPQSLCERQTRRILDPAIYGCKQLQLDVHFFCVSLNRHLLCKHVQNAWLQRELKAACPVDICAGTYPSNCPDACADTWLSTCVDACADTLPHTCLDACADTCPSTCVDECADTCLVRAPNSKAAAVGACNRLHILFEQ